MESYSKILISGIFHSIQNLKKEHKNKKLPKQLNKQKTKNYPSNSTYRKSKETKEDTDYFLFFKRHN